MAYAEKGKTEKSRVPGKYGEPGGGEGGWVHNTKTHRDSAGADAIHKTLPRLGTVDERARKKSA